LAAGAGELCHGRPRALGAGVGHGSGAGPASSVRLAGSRQACAWLAEGVIFKVASRRI